MLTSRCVPVLALAFVASCVGETTNGPDGGPDAADASTDSGLDSVAADVAVDTGLDAGTTYNDFADKSKWETMDTATLTGGKKGYNGGVFDGRYVNFVPQGDATTTFGMLLRYDTTKPFVTASYEKYDLTLKSSALNGFTGGLFDGTYVYLIPYNNGNYAIGSYQGNLVRYKPSSPFSDATSYETFNLATLSALSVGFAPGAFDGKYAYLTPFNSRNAVRYDTAAALGSTGSYESITSSTTLEYWVVAAFDGRYVYHVPGLVNGDKYYGGIKRYDTTKPFNQATSWLLYDIGTAIDVKAVGFQGVVFDGRYLYLIPSANNLVMRYDTQAQFDTASSWTKFDLTLVNAGIGSHVGGTFDGRYVYFTPFPGSIAVRYDTQQAFAATPSWQTFDTTSTDPAAKRFAGAVFDGTYVYFVPNGGTVAARFNAKTPPSLPKLAGSFY